ncbi:hypothetical protein KY345_07025 [Candidatus Woesearchaeota archaeon]|nr:hypothetical protein [Candidatus Woesearchaeota archaeon]
MADKKELEIMIGRLCKIPLKYLARRVGEDEARRYSGKERRGELEEQKKALKEYMDSGGEFFNFHYYGDAREAAGIEQTEEQKRISDETWKKIHEQEKGQMDVLRRHYDIGRMELDNMIIEKCNLKMEYRREKRKKRNKSFNL